MSSGAEMRAADQVHVADEAGPTDQAGPTDEVGPADEAAPTDEAQLGEVLARASAAGTACSIVGGATKREWGNHPRPFELVVSTAGLRGFSDVDPDNLTLSVAAGTTVAEARARAEAVNRILPLDPGHPGRATVGGVAATGDQGGRAAGYGGLRDVVLGVRATLADGSAVKFGGRTMKNVTGYDMTKLFLGSFGVLGVITEITFRLLPRYDTQAVVVLPLASLPEAKTSVARILGSYLQPLALEVVSADALPPDLASAAARLPAAVRSPGKAVAGGPTIGARPVLVAGFSGHRAAVDRSIREVTEAHPGTGARTLADGAAESLYAHLADSGTGAIDGSEGNGGEGEPRGLALRGSVPISRTVDLILVAQNYAGANGLGMSYRAGAARGRVDLLFVAAGDGAGKEGLSQERSAACLSHMRAEATGMGGSLFVTGGSAFLPGDYDAWGDVGPALAVMKRIKERFDPKGILNRGRFVGGI